MTDRSLRVQYSRVPTVEPADCGALATVRCDGVGLVRTRSPGKQIRLASTGHDFTQTAQFRALDLLCVLLCCLCCFMLVDVI